MIRALGWLLGIENATAIDRIDVSLAAPWAADSAFWVFLIAAAFIAGSLIFYLKWQQKGPRGPRIALAVFRGILLALLLFTLADPILQLIVENKQAPFLYVIFDGTDSMAIEDELPDAERAAIEKAVGYTPTRSTSEGVTLPKPANGKPSRIAYLQSLLRKSDNNPFTKLTAAKKVQLEAFLFDGNTTSQLRKLNLSKTAGGAFDPAYLAEQLTTKGQVTALGSVVHEVGQQFGSGRLAGVVLF
ncbi:MAG TPA: hypothetical protein VFB80_07780, partial [Pirellulaceae bacterium]|nr:hypothetical protein [Pirellulaceae bacterium]